MDILTILANSGSRTYFAAPAKGANSITYLFKIVFFVKITPVNMAKGYNTFGKNTMPLKTTTRKEQGSFFY
jgi:hypothetical protein